MPSPFPGMDPYLESPSHWPDFHDRFAEVMSSHLNARLPGRYYAELASRQQIGIADEGAFRRIVPDVTVNRTEGNADREESAVAILDQPRSTVSESLLVELPLDVEDVSYVQIRDARTADEVVTVIELLSPSNKLPGEDRDDYIRKRNDLLASETSLIEIDLLRKGSRSWAGIQLEERLRRCQPAADYAVILHRAWPARMRSAFQLFPIPLPSPLPVVPVPLLEKDGEVALDLQFAFNETYDRGPFRRKIDYSREPEVSVTPGLAEWVRDRVRGRSV